MSYIVLDLEWNHPYSRSLFVHNDIGTLLTAEIIQFGAVKLSQSLEIADTFKCHVKPFAYKKVHKKIKSITNISDSDLLTGQSFPLSFESFRQWCGPDAIFLTWGSDDLPILKQNAEYHHLDFSWLGCSFNLQPIFNCQYKLSSGQKSLEFAIDYLKIEKEQRFHDALSDAQYTALVVQKLDIVKGIMEYSSDFKEDSDSGEVCSQYFHSKEAAFHSSFASVCPKCGKAGSVRLNWTKETDKKYITLFDCSEDGKIFVRLKFSKIGNRKYAVRKNFYKAEGEILKYYDSKRVAAIEKRKNYLNHIKRANTK